MTLQAPVTPGDYEVRFYAAGLAPPLTVGPLVVSASLAAFSVDGSPAPEGTTVAAGAPISVSVTGAPANPADMVLLYAASETNLGSGYLDLRFLNDTQIPPTAGVSTATVHFVAPSTPGSYVFRLLTESSGFWGFGVVATSGVVTVAASTTLAAPTLSVAAGTYTADQAVVVNSSDPGVTLRYTQDGTDPSETDAVIAVGGTITVSRPQELRVRAFKSGMEPSAITAALYTLQVATPSITPSTSAFSTPQAVALTTTTAGAAIRYTVDGSEPSASSAVYAQALLIEATTTLKAQAFRTDWSDSALASATLTITPGTLSTPVASPSGGWIGASQHVTLVADAGTEIRYTLDGTEPTDLSTQYTTGVAIPSTGATLKARAFRTGWTGSGIATAVYQIDTAPPTITATLSPAPNPAGWNNTPVTVSFECFDESAVASCPAPVVVAQDGAGQLVTVGAVDAWGLQRNLTITVNIDSQPPIIALTFPTANVSTTDTTIELSGNASDLDSGLVSASCNRQWANPSGGTFSCSVPLKPGQNTVIAVAVDLAGNSASAGIRVKRDTPPTALSMSPTSVALAVGDAKLLTVTTDTGLPATGLTWESDNPSVVAIGPDNDGTITGETLGVATVTARAGGLTAEAIIRVLPDGVSLGEAIWTSPPTPGLSLRDAFPANPVQDDDPDLFTVEAENYASPASLVRAIRGADGATLWTESIDALYPGVPIEPPIADAFGGLLVKGTGGFIAEFPESPTQTLRRIGNDVVAPWEYFSEAGIGPVASGPDGTVYLIEYGIGSREVSPPSHSYETTYNTESSIVALDGRTGIVKFRAPMAMGRFLVTERTNMPEPGHAEDIPPYVEPLEHCQAANFSVRDGGTFGPIFVLDNGDAFVQQAVQDYQNTSQCPGMTNGTASVGSTLLLWHVTGSGVVSSRVLADWSGTFPTNPVGVFDAAGQEYFFEGASRPDGHDGVLASWQRQTYDGTTNIDDQWITQVNPTGGLTPRADPGQGSSSIMVTSLGTAYFQENGGLMARDTNTWDALWPVPLPVTPAYGLDDGGLVAIGYDEDANPLIQQIDANGTVIQSYPTTIYGPLVIYRDSGVLHGFNVNGALEMISVHNTSLAAQFTYDNRAYSQCKVTKLNFDMITEPSTQIGLVPDRGSAYKYRLDDNSTNPLAEAWRPKQEEAVKKAFRIWDETSSQRHLGYAFVEASTGETPDIVVYKTDITLAKHQPEGTSGFFQPGALLANRRITEGEILLTIDERYLLSEVGYLKATLHEIGHALGLAHPWGLGINGGKIPPDFPIDRQATVMNNLGYKNPTSSSPLVLKRDDGLNNIPLQPTKCDVIGVGLAKGK